MGRVKAYEAIVKGKNIPAPGVPESFKVLIKELESLCLDVKVLDGDHNEIVIKELEDEEEEYDRGGASAQESGNPAAEDEESADEDLAEGDGDDFEGDDDVFDFDDVPSFEDISLDDLDDK